MNRKKGKEIHFEYDFEDRSPNTMVFDFSDIEDDRLAFESHGENNILFVNRDAALVLARIFLRIAKGSYENGFHVHLHEDFDADKPLAIAVAVVGNSKRKSSP